MNSKAPSKRAVASELGSAQKLWDRIVATLSETYGSVDQEWKPSKAPFGWICLVKHKTKTLVYLTPAEDVATVIDLVAIKTSPK